MARKHVKKLPVVESERVVGIVSTSNIVRANPTQLGFLEELLNVR